MRLTSHQSGRGRVISITVKLYDDISWAKLTLPTATPPCHDMGATVKGFSLNRPRKIVYVVR